MLRRIDAACRVFLVVLVPATLMGCAPALSSFTPAHVAKPGHVQLEAGMDVSVPPNNLRDIYDSAKTIARLAQDEHRELTSDERNQLLRGAATELLNPVSANAHFGLGVGVYKNVELQGRWFTGGWRLGGRFQFLTQKEHGIDLSAGLGLGRYNYSFGVPDILDIVSIDDYSRWMLDIPVLIGRHGDWYRWWAGPKALFGSYHAGATIDVPTMNETYGFKLKGTSRYLGAQVGGALGYKWIFIATELTVVQFSSVAKFTAEGSDTEPYRPRLSGAIVYPGVALLGEF